MKTITIEVTQEDIEKGEQGSCSKCPIAMAMIRAFAIVPGVTDISVGISDADIYYGRKRVAIDLPPIATEFVIDFDNKFPVQPFTFQLEIPE